MNRIPMAKPVGVIVPDYRYPITRIPHLQLNSELENAFSAALVGAAKPDFIRQQIKAPCSAPDIGINHRDDYLFA